MLQEPKQTIDVGQIGNPSTGDILYDGGTKLNAVIRSLYATYGDYRLIQGVGGGDGVAILHATGYYQKLSRNYYLSTPIDRGSIHDVDTSAGSLTITLPNGVIGEGCHFINSNSSISQENPLIIRPQAAESIIGVIGDLIITSPTVKIVLWCVGSDVDNVFWNYSIEPLFSNSNTPIEKTFLINDTTPTKIKLCGASEYSALNLLISAINIDETEKKTSTTLLDINFTLIQSVESQIIKYGTSDVYSIEYYIEDGYVYCDVVSLNGSARIAIKSTDTISFNSATT